MDPKQWELFCRSVFPGIGEILFMPVSYTHLDVYKRQLLDR